MIRKRLKLLLDQRRLCYKVRLTKVLDISHTKSGGVIVDHSTGTFYLGSSSVFRDELDFGDEIEIREYPKTKILVNTRNKTSIYV